MLEKIIGQTNKYLLYDWLRSRRDKETADKRTHFYSQFLKPGQLFYDVGANLGNRIIPALNLGARVVAFEPDKYCADFLEIKFGKRIELIRKGLSEKEEELDMFVSDKHSSISSFSKEWIHSVDTSGRFGNAKWDNSVRIPMTTLNNIIERTGIPQFIKIDVEGFELQVLKGLSYRVPFISFEYTVPEMIESALACIRRIADNGGVAECNYSVGESMEWGSDLWLPVEEMLQFIKTESFIRTGSGDVYVRVK